MKSKILFVLLAICNSYLFAQTNVGIGTTTPTEKLDVNGNINVHGTIKANGVAGQSSQVLMTNAGGILSWGDISQFKSFIGFSVPGTYTWNVPAGITKILVEGWGGGGGGGTGGGGGGGGYVQGIMPVISGDVINITVGLGGNVNTNGQQTIVSNGPLQLYAHNGIGGAANSTGPGGGFLGLGTGLVYFGQNGEGGYPTIEKYEQNSTSTFVRAIYFGNGGNAGNTKSTGGIGNFQSIQLPSTSLAFNGGSPPAIPGGGAGTGQTGASGMVIIRY